MNIFDKHIFDKVESIRLHAENEISKVSRIQVRLYVEVAEKEDEGIVAQALRIIASALWMNYDDYMSRDRDRSRSDLRAIAATLIKKYYPSIPVSQIAKMFMKDHTTILHALKRTKNLMDGDALFYEKYQEADRRLSQFITEKKFNK